MKGVKIFRKAEMSTECIHMVKREIELTRKLDHPNICRVSDVLEDEKKIYLIIDDLNGISLFQYILSKNVVSEEDTAAIAA